MDRPIQNPAAEEGDKDDGQAKKSGPCQCNVEMLPSKLTYFLRGGARSSAVSYLTLFLTSLGLTVQQAGRITSLQYLLSIISGPSWGYVADRTQRRKLCWTVLGLGSLISLGSLPFVGAILTHKNTSIDVGKRGNDTSGIPHNVSSGNRVFYAMLCLVPCSNMFFSPMNGLEDSFVLNIIQKSPKNLHIGDQKAFLSIGISVSGLLVGQLVDMYDDPVFSKYAPAFYVCIPFLLFRIFAGLLVESQGKWNSEGRNEEEEEGNETEETATIEEEAQGDTPEKGRMKLLLTVMGNLHYISILITAIVTGITNAVRFTYLTQLMKDQMNSTGIPMGLAYFVPGLIGTCVFFRGDWFLKLCGDCPVILIECSVFLYIIPAIVESYLTNAWFVFLLEILGSTAFVFFWIGAYAYVGRSSHPDIYITLFAILASCYYDVSGILGALVGGWVYQTWGGDMLFFGKGVMTALWFLCLVVYHHVVPRLRREDYAPLSTVE